MIHLGVTGTSNGASEMQVGEALNRITIVASWQPVTLHQGCCVGFDAQITKAVRDELPQVRICAHPPTNTKLISRPALELSDVIMPADEYLARDRDIVHHALKGIIAAPGGTRFRARGSGTSYTVKYAVEYYQDGEQVDVLLPPSGRCISGAEFIAT